MLTLAIFTLVFSRAAKVDTGTVPYPVFAICGMSAWVYFAYVMREAGSGMVTMGNMIKKIYFPRLILPFSKAVVGLVDFSITLVLVILLMVYYGVTPSANIVFLPLFFLANVVAALAVGIWLSALTVRFRDFLQIIPFSYSWACMPPPLPTLLKLW